MDRKEGGWKLRIVFVGAGSLSVMTARALINYGHEIIIIERDRTRIDELSEELDCGFLHGDGSKPALLREADPENTDFLFCLTGSDQMNIIAGLVGRSQGFNSVVTKIEDRELEHICTELGLENTIIPTRTISRFLTDMVSGRDILELSTMIKGEARFFSFIVREEDEGAAGDLQLPKAARAICFYRDKEFRLIEEDSSLQKGDEVIILTHSKNLSDLRERWKPGSGNNRNVKGGGAHG